MQFYNSFTQWEQGRSTVYKFWYGRVAKKQE